MPLLKPIQCGPFNRRDDTRPAESVFFGYWVRDTFFAAMIGPGDAAVICPYGLFLRTACHDKLRSCAVTANHHAGMGFRGSKCRPCPNEFRSETGRGTPARLE